ncbi:MAG TPA: DUF4397 domain-containing protein [Myxococcaceae bacterium]|nr:DUF4397 domain-containing protein [Myxococcaceae bacterium]
MLRLAATSVVLLLALGLACDSGPPGPAQIRIAHFIADGPGVDVCLKPDGTAAYSGKFVNNGGLNFASMSSRTGVDAGTYSLRIVAASATDCSTSLNGLGDIGGISLDGDTPYTVALLGLLSGSGNTGVAERSFTDDTGAPASPGVKLRYVHVSAELPQVDVGVLSGSTFLPLNPAVTLNYGDSSVYYAYGAGVSNATLAVEDHNTQALDLSGTFSATGGTVNSVYVVGRPTQTSGDPRLSFLMCPENGTPICFRFP